MARSFTSDDGLAALRDDERQAREDALRLAQTATYFAERADDAKRRWERARMALDAAEQREALARRAP
jgi:hypothetical protein